MQIYLCQNSTLAVFPLSAARYFHAKRTYCVINIRELSLPSRWVQCLQHPLCLVIPSLELHVASFKGIVFGQVLIRPPPGIAQDNGNISKIADQAQ